MKDYKVTNNTGLLTRVQAENPSQAREHFRVNFPGEIIVSVELVEFDGTVWKVIERPTDYIALVKEFHEMFKHPVRYAPQIPPTVRCELRGNLLKEEVQEFIEAMAAGDIVEALDALADIQYVLSGAVLELGLHGAFEEAFKEVHRSNMSKACKDADEATQTEAFYNNDGIETYVEEHDGKYLVYRKSDNKTLKSVGYSPANLRAIILPEGSDQF